MNWVIMMMSTTTGLAGSVTGQAGTRTGHPAMVMMLTRMRVTARMRRKMMMKMKRAGMMSGKRRNKKGARWPKSYLK